MAYRIAVMTCIFFLLIIGAINCQRDGRRRTNRRKSTTLPPIEDAVSESSSGVPDSEPTFESGKASIAAPHDSEISVPTNSTSAKTNGSMIQVLAPRGTRKPRPMPSWSGSAEGKPKPTLPTFVRKNSGRMRKTSPIEEDKIPVTQSSNANKLGRSSSRRRGSTTTTITSSKIDAVDMETTSSPRNKKRFGGGSRPARGHRRSTTTLPLS